jgi:hypothetical protein
LTNNLKALAEDQPTLVQNIKNKAKELDNKRLKRMVEQLGTVSTKKLFASTI